MTRIRFVLSREIAQAKEDWQEPVFRGAVFLVAGLWLLAGVLFLG